MTSVLFAAGTFLHYLFGFLMFVVALFLILLVLVQRGRGGGLTGALGGMGGQSAFGTKAGDMFTRVTMVTAGVWILLCMLSIWLLGTQDEWGGSGKSRSGGTTQGTTTVPGPVSPVAPGSPSPGTGAAAKPPASTGTAAAPAAETKPAPAAAKPAMAEAPEAPPSPAPKAKE
jgi:preprotein translocase subunit SecG